jgi:hypothetical protein
MRWKPKAALVVVAGLTLGVGAYAGTGGANVPMQAETCTETGAGWQPKIETTGDPASVTVTAPEGFLIDAYCVKAGQFTEIITVDPPQATVTIQAPTGQAVSHYQIHLVPVTPPTTGAPPTTGVPPTTGKAPQPPAPRAVPQAPRVVPQGPAAPAPSAVRAAPRVTG